MSASMKAKIGGRTFTLSAHVIERYRDRFRPELGFFAAGAALREELERSAEIHLTLPAWGHEFVLTDRFPDEWVTLEGSGMLFPVRGRILQTCLSRGTVGATIRFVR